MLEKASARALGVGTSGLGKVAILRRSLDCRKGVCEYRFRIRAFVKGEEALEYDIPEYRDVADAMPVIVIGCGPAGLFASLRLIMEGIKPVILERGKDVHSRRRDCAGISRHGVIDPDSNYCYGEGGAGAFSDGKLFTRSTKRGDIREVLYQFVRFGADPDILIDAHPHIGSDVLPKVVENMRSCIIEHGGECHFNSKVTDLRSSGDGWTAVCADGTSYSSSDVILASGHSATEFYDLFAQRGWALSAKGFALGVRAEHKQSLIDGIQYRGRRDPQLPPAEYSLLTQVRGRGVFSFCMCPGGVIIPSSTSEGETVLNGMSDSRRSSRWANAGIVCSIEPGDIPGYGKYGPLELLEFQKNIERRMWNFSKSFKAPAQRMTDFCIGRLSRNLPATSYSPGVVCAPLHLMLPEQVADRLREALPLFGGKMKGFFNEDALLLAVESRTSSPVRILRDPVTFQSLSLPHVYPCGEGAGYSGGIVSSAIDGICAACAVAAEHHITRS